MPILFLMLVITSYAFGYENLPSEPSDFNSLIEFVMSAIGAFKAGSIGMGIGLVITALLGLMKMVPFLKSSFDKLGAWKFIIPMALGAIAELAFNLPKEISFKEVVALIVQGVQANGMIAIAFHHILDKFKKQA